MDGPPFEYADYEEGRNVNYWRLNPALQAAARRVYPDEEFEWANERLEEFGGVVGHTIADNADLIDEHGPELRTYDKHGDLLNEVRYHPKQFENEELIYERGILADAFEPPPGRDEPLGLLHTLTMQLLLSYADTGLVCSQSMTVGAALVLRNHDHGNHYEEYFEELTAREYDEVIEGGMFLTEEQGGSDVGATETVAEPVGVPREGEGSETDDADGIETDDSIEARTYELTGEKWFCSNIDAQGTLALARRPGAPEGTKGLSLFLVPHELPGGELNPQIYRRLKDKLGTESVPTGEVEFDGTVGYLVGEPERGFKYMTTMLNWERVTNSVGAVGIIGRLLLESKIHAANREAFGQPIGEFPLLQRDLVEMAVTHEAALSFAMEAARWFDRYERDHGDDRAFRLMRLLVPVSKHVTTRAAVDTASYAMEIQGGNGYVREFVTHRLYRDVQALPIWEGTANILSLDVLRAMEKERAHEELLPLVEGYLDDVDHPLLAEQVKAVRGEFRELQEALVALATADGDYAQHEAKEVTEYVYDVVSATLLLSRAQRSLAEREDARGAVVARLFIEETFSESDARGVTTGEALPMQYFDAVVRYDSVDPDRLVESSFG
ncbi:acyl-CoA dehydrogenase family protein [Halalkaliarchaeum sp. AArc-GB]|uniref:acyl-CoA dehydrogenase family protein n=1 Tax=Halalkaliarchaeum sp. AArc-GB TaxID=3074078 RepID=UPI00285DFBAF|nr:acyl-CoA dehydrogenase family protein [Halalkaliarchaeum sp. AArc-GB]MDR5673183.1 acyl-CoA dehydrogenase family protein [Halalkaliarchaeum sp. AArc-GB]